MNDERPTHGGAANMPPFPRASNTEPERPVDPPPPAPTDEAGDDSPQPGLEAAPSAERAAVPADADPAQDLGDFNDSDEMSDFDDVPADYLDADDELDAEELDLDLGEDDVDDDLLDDDDESASLRSAIAAEIGRRAELSVLTGMEAVADTFDETAHRLSRLIQLRAGPEASLGPVTSTVTWLEGAADYLRSSDLEAVRSDLRQRVRKRPVQSLGIALCTGWLLGRILR